MLLGRCIRRENGARAAYAGDLSGEAVALFLEEGVFIVHRGLRWMRTMDLVCGLLMLQRLWWLRLGSRRVLSYSEGGVSRLGIGSHGPSSST